MPQQAWSPSLLAEETAMEGLVPLPWEGGSEKWPKVQGAEQGPLAPSAARGSCTKQVSGRQQSSTHGEDLENIIATVPNSTLQVESLQGKAQCLQFEKPSGQSCWTGRVENEPSVDSKEGSPGRSSPRAKEELEEAWPTPGAALLGWGFLGADALE